MRTVCVVTGTRAEYGILRPVMRTIEKRAKLSLQVVATGMHLEARHGHTVDEIERDGFRVDATVEMTPKGDTPADMGGAIGRGIVGLTDTLGALSPEVVLVLGDRMEAFAVATAGVFCGCCLAHIHGGDRARAGFDDSMRHAITKLAHVHFPATEQSMERIIRMGEREENVFLVGAPGLDETLAGPVFEREELGEKLEADLSTPPVVVVQHPVSTRPDDAAAEMIETMEAVAELDAPVIVIYPNNDAGGRRMIEVIRKYENRENVKTFASLARTVFLSVLRCASALVGNSSCGIIEAASFELPVVNVGERQAGRERARNVIDVAANQQDIRVALRKCLLDKDFRESLKGLENPYGDGHASERIVEALEEITIDHALLQKQIAY